MKKCLVGLLLGMVMLAGCGSNVESSQPAQNNVQVNDNRTTTEDTAGNGSTVVDNRQKDNTSSAAASVATAEDSDFEKTGYLYENSIGDSLYFYIVKNNSQATVAVNGNATAFDSDGNAVGASQREIDVLGPGETSLMTFYFDSVTGIDKVDCALIYDTETYYKPVLGNIRMEQTINDQNLTVIATNDGNINAQFVEAYALFFDADNKLVSYDSTYVTDGDSEIKPGGTISVQLDTYKGFDHVECYLTGRSDGQASTASSGVSDSDFAVKEYLYENSIGDSMYFLAITNNSDKTVGINGNMTAYDAGGNVIGADSGSIDVLGPGEQSIMSFYFDSVKGIDNVQYTLGYDTEPYYKSGLEGLEVVQNINAKNVVVTVTNNGTEASQFVEAYALFLDSAGKVVRYDSTYIVDGDSEIKPGATLSKQLDTYEAFDTVEVYLTGRRGGY